MEKKWEGDRERCKIDVKERRTHLMIIDGFCFKMSKLIAPCSEISRRSYNLTGNDSSVT